MTSMLELVISPSTRTLGRSPAVMCRSEAPRSIISSSRTRRLRLDGAVLGAVINVPGYRDAWRVARGASLLHASRATHLASRGSFPDHLFDGRDPLQHLHPRVHAQREHPFLDRAVADLGRARVHDDQPANLLTHRHHLIDALAALQSRSRARVATGALEEAKLADRRIERRMLETGQCF